MKKRLIALFLLLLFVFSLTSCNKTSNSSFKITFIDVGQGDCALIECDGERMLIDVGPDEQESKNNIRELLKGKLDYLVISHCHRDHYGGLIESKDTGRLSALLYTEIDTIICNEDPFALNASNNLSDLKQALDNLEIHNVPKVKYSEPGTYNYTLGSAKFAVLNVSSGNDNDSLVILMEYQNAYFLFAGDIEEKSQKILTDKLDNMSNIFKNSETLIKMPHHGAYSKSLEALFDVYDPDYAIISSGKKSQYGHPSDKTVELITKRKINLLITATENRNISVTLKNNGKLKARYLNKGELLIFNFSVFPLLSEALISNNLPLKNHSRFT